MDGLAANAELPRQRGVFAIGLERAVKLYANELTIGLLVECADPYVTDNLSSQLLPFHLWQEV